MITSLKERLDDQARISQNDVQHATSKISMMNILAVNEYDIQRNEMDYIKETFA